MSTASLRVCASFAAMVIAGAAVLAQAPARTQQKLDPPTGTAVIAGVIRDQNGTPVPRATVTVAGDMQLTRSVLNGDDGRFSVADLPAGRFTITAEKPGYPRMSYGAKTPFRSGAGVFLRDGQSVSIDVVLARGAVLTGTAYDEQGEPMPGLGVMAWEIRTSLAGERTLDMPATGGEWVVTDERGRYRIFGLPPGQYTVGTYWAFHGQGFETRTLTPAELDAAFSPAAANRAAGAMLPPETPRLDYSPVFTPGVADPLSATTYTLGPGDEQNGVDLRMQFVPMGSVEATITGPDGAPASSYISLIRRSPVSALNTRSAYPGGGSVFRSSSLVPGLYTLLSEVQATETSPVLWASADFNVSPGESHKLALILQPAPTARAALRFESSERGAPLKDLSRVSVWLRLITDRGPRTSTAVSPDGTARITGVVPGRYVVTATVPAAISAGVSWTMKTVTVGGQDVTDRPFDIGPAGPEEIVITFTDRAAELSGTISTTRGGSASDFFVIAMPADREYWLPITNRRIVSTRPDASGRYVFRNLPPGEYRIALTTDLVPRDLQDFAALERLAAASAPFTIRAGEAQTLDLKAGG